MKEVENMLKNRKKEMDNIEVPNDLEDRLLRALRHKKVIKKKRANWKVRVAALLIIFLLVGYNFDTLAYYGKKLIGYDTVMNGTLRELNELEKGQIIGKKYTFDNGIILTLDGIMIDENQMLAFYSLEDPSGKIDVTDMTMSQNNFKGLIETYDNSGGKGKSSEDGTEIKWISSFEPPRFFERNLSFRFNLIGEDIRELGEISFKIDRDKAMGYSIKKTINKKVEIEGKNILFKSITASPTTTVIKGSIDDIISLAIDEIKGERYRANQLNFDLIANGKVIDNQGSGMSTNLKGITFYKEFDTLPTDLESLKIKLKSLSVIQDVDKKVSLKKGKDNGNIEILGETISIDDVYEKNGETFISLTTEEDTILTIVYLLADGKKVKIEETLSDDYEKKDMGSILHNRTFRFKGTGNELKLYIEKMTYTKESDKEINIPID
ncbi:MAG: DUF4179 domain-containing protein [Firmicutes bacterium]|nr:DUF4179 domain-containing protein [Bacillota bacterium]